MMIPCHSAQSATIFSERARKHAYAAKYCNRRTAPVGVQNKGELKLIVRCSGKPQHHLNKDDKKS